MHSLKVDKDAMGWAANFQFGKTLKIAFAIIIFFIPQYAKTDFDSSPPHQISQSTSDSEKSAKPSTDEKAKCEHMYQNLIRLVLETDGLPERPSVHLYHLRNMNVPRPIPSHGVLVDTQILVGILRLREKGVNTESTYINTLNNLAEKMGVSRNDLLDPKFQKEFFYVTHQTLKELAEGHHPNIKQQIAFNVIPAPSKAYVNTLQSQIEAALTAINVGRRNGFSDRRIIVEAFLTKTDGGRVPTFVTADKGIYNALCKISPECKGPDLGNGKPVWQRFPLGFNAIIKINIDGKVYSRRIVVMPVSTTMEISSAPPVTIPRPRFLENSPETNE